MKRGNVSYSGGKPGYIVYADFQDVPCGNETHIWVQLTPGY